MTRDPTDLPNTLCSTRLIRKRAFSRPATSRDQPSKRGSQRSTQTRTRRDTFEKQIYIYMKSHEHVPLNFFTPFVHHTVGNFVAWTAQNSHPSVLDEQVVAVGLYISSENRRKPHPRPAFTFNSCSPAPFLLSRVKRLQNAPFPRWLSELRSMVEVCSADVQRKRYSGFRVDRTNVEGRWLKWTSICLRHLGGPVPSTLKPVY